jgi:penicillin-binding protein 1A
VPIEVKEVISLETARTMMQLLRAVVTQGTGAAASQLKHPLGGKTGTTNDFTDAWFVGFSPGVTCGTWIGFDDRQSLGEKETGARAALPMWMDFMRAAIATRPNETFPTAGAPKRQLDVTMPGQVAPPVKKPVPAGDTDSDSDDDSDAPAAASPAKSPGDAAPQDAPEPAQAKPQSTATPTRPVVSPSASRAAAGR